MVFYSQLLHKLFAKIGTNLLPYLPAQGGPCLMRGGYTTCMLSHHASCNILAYSPQATQRVTLATNWLAHVLLLRLAKSLLLGIHWWLLVHSTDWLWWYWLLLTKVLLLLLLLRGETLLLTVDWLLLLESLCTPLFIRWLL